MIYRSYWKTLKRVVEEGVKRSEKAGGHDDLLRSYVLKEILVSMEELETYGRLKDNA